MDPEAQSIEVKKLGFTLLYQPVDTLSRLPQPHTVKLVSNANASLSIQQRVHLVTASLSTVELVLM